MIGRKYGYLSRGGDGFGDVDAAGCGDGAELGLDLRIVDLGGGLGEKLRDLPWTGLAS